MSESKNIPDKVCLKRLRDSGPTAGYSVDESGVAGQRLKKASRNIASVDVSECRSEDRSLLVFSSIGNEGSNIRALYNVDNQTLNLKCGDSLEIRFSLKHAWFASSKVRFAAKLPSGDISPVRFSHDETYGHTVCGRLHPQEPGILLAYVNGRSVPLLFKDIDVAGKIILQASLEFTMLANTGDLQSYIPNLTKRMGAGNEGAVYPCYVLGSGKEYALRVSRKNKDGASKALRLQRILANRQICGRNIVPEICDVFDRNGVTYEVHELIPDGDLFQAINENTFDWYDCKNILQANKFNEILSIVVQMLQILQILYEEGISHLDLSPENFMLRKNEDGDIDLLVIDFGHAEQKLSDITGLRGKPIYHAPEIFEYAMLQSLKDFDANFALQKYEELCATPYDHKADCFSIGQILYVMLYKKHPTYREDVRKDNFGLAPCQVSYFNTLLTNLLARNPQHRWSAAVALDHIQGMIPKPEVPPGLSEINENMWEPEMTMYREYSGLLEPENLFG